MKIAVAADHGGFAFKQKLVEFLKERDHEVKDFGCHSNESCDYPDFGIPAVSSVSSNESERGILICTNGIGMSMLANKLPGIKAALVYSRNTAERTRQHHGSNVLCLGAGEFTPVDLFEFVTIWLSTDFQGGRHERRVDKILALDRKVV